MQSSRLLRSLVIAFLSFLLLTSFSFLFKGVVSAEEAPELVIPHAFDRDHVEFDIAGTAWESYDGSVASPTRLEFRLVTQYLGLQTVMDQSGAMRQTVAVERVRIPILPESEPTASYGWFDDTSRAYYEIGSRHMVRLDLHEKRFFTDSSQNRTLVFLGPDFQNNAEPSWRWDIEHVLQGRVLRVGDDLSEEVRIARVAWCLETHRKEWVVSPVQSDWCRADVNLYISGRAILQGRDVWEIREENFHEERLYFPGTGWEIDSYWDNTTYWFSKDSPYPLRFENEFALHYVEEATGVLYRYDERKVGFVSKDVRAGEPILWGPALERIPHAERADVPLGQGIHPVTGSGWKGVYPVEDALRNIDQDVSLVELQVWRMQNPDSRVVGLQYSTTQACLPQVAVCERVPADLGVRWTVTYSAPFGQTIMRVHSDRLTDGRVANSIEDKAGLAVPTDKRFDPKRVPQGFVTLGGAHQLWEGVASPESLEREASFIRWGYFPCWVWTPDYCMPHLTLQEIWYGRVEQDPSLSATKTYYVSLDAATGLVNYALESETRREPLGVVPARAQASEAPRPVQAQPSAKMDPMAVAASASILILILAYLYPLVHQGLVGLYTKLVRNQLLDHALRDQVIQIIKQNPGISQPALKRLTKAGWSTITYHLGLLQKNHLITSVRDGRHRRWFPVGFVHHNELRRAAVLQNEKTRGVRDLIGAQPGVDRATLARLMGTTPAAVSWHLKRLLDAGLIKRVVEGRSVRYVPIAADPQAGRAELTVTRSAGGDAVPSARFLRKRAPYRRGSSTSTAEGFA